MAERLARFSAAAVADPRMFGGGADVADVRYRGETVAHGYLAVVEEFGRPVADAGPDRRPAATVNWCTLTVTLPAPAAAGVTVEHRSALGRPGVPVAGRRGPESGDRLFDRSYVVVGEHDLVGPVLRAALLQRPAQRVSLHGASLLLRTFDGVGCTDEAVEWLELLAESVLRSTPGVRRRPRRRGHLPAGTVRPQRSLVAVGTGPAPAPVRAVGTPGDAGRGVIRRPLALRLADHNGSTHGGEWSRLRSSRQEKRAEDRIADLVKKAMHTK